MSLNTTAPSYTAGQILTAAQLNTLQDGIQAAWTSYTPSWTSTSTNPTLGNGTITGAYLQIGKTVMYRMRIVAGSTTSYGAGAYLFSLPVTISSNYNFWEAIGDSAFLDASASTRYAFGTLYAGGGNASMFDGTSNRIGIATPVAPATGDQWSIQGQYEAA